MYVRYFLIRELLSKEPCDVNVYNERPNGKYIKAIVDTSADCGRGEVTIKYFDEVIRCHNIYPPRGEDGIEEWISEYDLNVAVKWLKERNIT